MTIYEQVKELHALGFNVIPTAYKTKKPAIKWQDYTKKRVTSEEIQAWFDNSKPKGYAVITGDISGGLLVIDFDHEKNKEGEIMRHASELYEVWRQDVDEIIKSTPVVKTGSGGFHVYVKTKDARTGARLLLNGQEETIDSRGNGGYVIGPGCDHESGGSYELISGSFDEIELVKDIDCLWLAYKSDKPAPAVVKEETKKAAGYGFELEEKLKMAQRYLDTAPESTSGDGGHDNTFKIAVDLVKGFDLGADAFELLEWYNANKCEPAWSDKEIRHKYAEALNSKKKPGYLLAQSFNKYEIINKLITDTVDGRLNDLTSQLEVSEKDAEAFRPISDRINSAIYQKVYKKALAIQHKNAGNWASQEVYRTALKSRFPIYNPIKSFFENLPEYDGKDHAAQVASMIPVPKEDKKFFYNCFLIWLTGCVAQGLGHDINELFLILSGPQGAYKTSFFRWLSPLPEYTYCGDIDPQNKDHRLRMCENFLIILDELESVFKKADIGRLKSMASETHINERRPYAEFPERRKRVASFCGSLNDAEFLQDHTGNRRWLIFTIEKNINPAYIELDVRQLWAQVKYMYENRERLNHRYKLNHSEIHKLHERNRQFTKVNPAEVLLTKHFTPGKHGQYLVKEMLFTDIMHYLQTDGDTSLDAARPHRISKYELSGALKECGFNFRLLDGRKLYFMQPLAGLPRKNETPESPDLDTDSLKY